MEKMELYHIHKIGDHDKVWYENAEIEVKNNFKNTMYRRCQDFTANVPLADGDSMNLYDLILKCPPVEIMPRQLIEQLLLHSYSIAFNATTFKRENAIDNYRKDNGIIHPGRLNCVYLTDEKGVDYWLTRLGNQNLEIFRVEATGNIFKTNEYFIPDERLSYEKVYEEAYKYWHPNLKKAPENTNEYLTQGKIKVLERIKTTN